MTEAPADDTEPVAPAPTLPMQAKVKKTANVIPTQGTAAGKGTPWSSKKQAKGKDKESDKPAESEDNDVDEEEEGDNPEQVLQTQQKRKPAPAAHFDASPESGKEQPKKKAKTAATASAEFKPPSRSGAQPSGGTVASPSGQVRWQEAWVPGWLRLRDRRRNKSPLTQCFASFCSHVCARPRALAFDANAIICP